MAGLAKRLRDGTWPLHTDVERSVFMRAMLRGQLPRAAYCLLLRNLHPLYAALETALLAHACHPGLRDVYLPALFRTRAIASDLDSLHGPAWPTDLEVLPASAGYQARLNDLGRIQPGLLVAHAYVRYLGDLSGGQQLRRIVARGLQLPASEGTTFYDFGNAGQCAELAGAFRTGLDAIPLDAEQIEPMVAEARDAFQRHGILFGQLADATGLSPAEALTAP